jgi:hypothetical protein
MPVRERDCTDCGRRFRGETLRCQGCRAPEHDCEGCGRKIRSNNNRLCGSCRMSVRQCSECGRVLRLNTARCQTCRATDRECVSCGQVFRGVRRRCPACRATERECVTCGETFKVWSGQTRCTACQVSGRQCSECGRGFRGMHARCRACRGPDGAWLARARQDRNARRARKRAAEIAGPVSAAVYAAVLTSGPCVYCGAPATAVDHVRPLARGGHEIAANLVPACGSCNSSKHDRLLIDWHPARVAHGVMASPLVAAEYARQLADASLSLRQMAGAS